MDIYRRHPARMIVYALINRRNQKVYVGHSLLETLAWSEVKCIRVSLGQFTSEKMQILTPLLTGQL
jgi:hypothetical protein